MNDYIQNVPDPSGNWLFERGIESEGTDVAFIRCPFCGAVIGLVDGAKAPKQCPTCNESVNGGDKIPTA